MNPLLDTDFLIKLNNDRNRTIYAHVISLNQYEHPIEQLEGVVTAGSITIDGQSAVRRTCTLTLSAKNLNINNVYWGLTTKVKIEIGLQNNIIGYEKYGDIIWFKQGVFILTDFKTTQTINNYIINLSGKDKMCLLNGDVAGNLPAPVIFDSYDDGSGQFGFVNEHGTYNSFLDNKAQKMLLDGFNERYYTDYTYIRTLGNIISLIYKPSSNTIPSNAKISFSASPKETDWKSLESISVKGENNDYIINIGDADIFGFQIKDCNFKDKFEWTIRAKIPIPLIIQEMMHQFGQEQYSNIIIKDIDPYGLEMLDNDTGEDYYLLHDGVIYTNLVSKDDLINNYKLYLSKNSEGTTKIIVDELILRNYIEEDDISLINILNGSTLAAELTPISQVVKKKDPSTIYTITPVRNKEIAGYGMTLLVYPSELKGEPGDSITSILDKIVNMMGNYEYFYDLNGQFVFQAKPAYVKTAWNNTIEITNNNYVDPSELVNKVAYTFDNAVLTTQYQNSPNINSIKNDYIIWGEKKNFNGNSIKFHGRYAINNIPLEYTDYKGFTWTSNKRESLLEAIRHKIEKAQSYTRKYSYPEGLDERWWEINDWAAYYSNVFGIDLTTDTNKMSAYSKIKSLSAGDKAHSQLGYFAKFFDTEHKTNSENSSSMSDVYTIIYNNSDKKPEHIERFYVHGSCTHYYYQFADLRSLRDDGWSYALDNKEQVKIKNIYNENQKYTLKDGSIAPYQWGYNPELTTSFIYDPILPRGTAEELLDFYTSLIYPNAKNENQKVRNYALPYDVDWRHLIHIMADDWYAHNHEDDFEINIRKNNSWPQLNINLFPYGKTNFEQYYLDFTSIGGFWQELYNIYYVKYLYYLENAVVRDESWDDLQSLFDVNKCKKNKFSSDNTTTTINITLWDKIISENYYNINISVATNDEKEILKNEIKYLNDYVLESYWEDNASTEPEYHLLICKISKNLILDKVITNNNISVIVDIINNRNPGLNYQIDPGMTYAIMKIHDENKQFFDRGAYKFWHKDVINNPEKLNFWFDFFRADEMGIGKFATTVIGDRPKTINDSNIKVIVYRDTPDVIYCTSTEKQYYEKSCYLKDGYKYIVVDDEVKQKMIRSIRSKSVHNQANDMLYQYSYYNDTVNITAIPIYYLQPNTIISIKDELSKIIGYYVMNRINISLAYNGMMQITAIKSPEKIY